MKFISYSRFNMRNTLNGNNVQRQNKEKVTRKSLNIDSYQSIGCILPQSKGPQTQPVLDCFLWRRVSTCFIIFKMKEEKANNRPQKYAKISLKRRERLVELVINKSMSILSASRRLGIKNSTAKLIIKRFKEGESFFESKQMKQLRMKKEKEQKEQRKPQNESQNELNTPFGAQEIQTITITFPFDGYTPSCIWNYYLTPFTFAFLPQA